jgi:CubicO group peptidase (beta-lactamase class C family)
MRDAHLPSLSAAVVKGETLAWVDGYGLADREKNIPADPDTVYMLASISKTFICGALMQLWEAGSVDLDGDVNDYLPFPVRNPRFPHSKITPRMLLTHTSSIKDRWSIWGPIRDPKPTGYVHGDATITLHDILAGYLVPGGDYYERSNNFTPNPPGHSYLYSNLGADLAAYIVEHMSGQLFSEYCMENLFKPLGMTDTGYHLADITTSNLAMPYKYNFVVGEYQPYYQFGYPDYPCGALRTTANSLSIWLRCFMNKGSIDGTTILKPSTVEEIFTPQVIDADDPSPQRSGGAQGLIWYYVKRPTGVVIGHTGGDYGVATKMFFDPARKTGIVALSNRYVGGGKHWYAYGDIEDRLFELA